MLIAQITDLHIGTGDDIGAEDNYRRLREVFRTLSRMQRKPDLMIATGDLTETGSVDAYRRLQKMMRDAKVDPLLCLGNHDVSENFSAVFGAADFDSGFLQYTKDIGEFRIIVLDSHDETIHGGAFCPARVAFLEEALAGAAGKKVVIALHHPPIMSGIDWMGALDHEEDWIRAIRGVIGKHDNIVKIMSGHIHRPMARLFAGAPLVVSSATAAEVALELAPITSKKADGRPLIVDEPPGFALHWWDGREFVTHFGVAGDFHTILEYHDRFRPVMKDVFHVP